MLSPSPQPPVPTGAPGTLSYRLATEDDFALLMRYRDECGWGQDRLRERWMDPDFPLCVFVLVHEGVKQDVGMGGWILEEEGHASKKDGWVKLSSLFISKSFQGLGLGRLAMGLLEKLAVDLFQARVITLDTAAYEVVRTSDGPEWAWVELAGQESRNSLWYKKRGFEAYGDIVPLFQDPKKPEVKFHAAFLKKTAQAQTPVTVN